MIFHKPKPMQESGSLCDRIKAFAKLFKPKLLQQNVVLIKYVMLWALAS